MCPYVVHLVHSGQYLLLVKFLYRSIFVGHIPVSVNFCRARAAHPGGPSGPEGGSLGLEDVLHQLPRHRPGRRLQRLHLQGLGFRVEVCGCRV